MTIARILSLALVLSAAASARPAVNLAMAQSTALTDAAVTSRVTVVMPQNDADLKVDGQ